MFSFPQFDLALASLVPGPFVRRVLQQDWREANRGP